MSKCKHDTGRCTECSYEYCIDEEEDEEAVTIDEVRDLINLIVNKLGISQRKLGMMLGVNKNRVSSWNTGKYIPNEGNMQKLRTLAEAGHD